MKVAAFFGYPCGFSAYCKYIVRLPTLKRFVVVRFCLIDCCNKPATDAAASYAQSSHTSF